MNERRYTIRDAAAETGEPYWRLHAMCREGWLEFTWRGRRRLVTLTAVRDAIRRETDARNDNDRQSIADEFAHTRHKEMTFADTGF